MVLDYRSQTTAAAVEPILTSIFVDTFQKGTANQPPFLRALRYEICRVV